MSTGSSAYDYSYYEPDDTGSSAYDYDYYTPDPRPRNKRPDQGNQHDVLSTQRPGSLAVQDFLRLQGRMDQNAASAAMAAARANRQSVFDWVRGQFQMWNLGDLGDDVVEILRHSRSEAQALVRIRDTDAYKRRFAGNIARAKAGFGMLDEVQYLAMESAYRQAMHAAGLPEGFYDSPNDFADWIGNDVSPEEIARRADIAGDLAVNKDPNLWRALKERGITKGEAAAYMLDPDRALPAIERKVAAAQIGAEADRAGMGFAKGKRFENRLADAGVTPEQARAAFASVNEDNKDIAHLRNLEGDARIGDKALAKGELGLGDGRTKRKVKALASRERARWGGTGGGAATFGGSADTF